MFFRNPKGPSAEGNLLTMLSWVLAGRVPASDDTAIPQVLRDVAARVTQPPAPWRPLEREPVPADVMLPTGFHEAWSNDVYRVLVRRMHPNGPDMPRGVHLSIKRHDKGAGIPWRHRQRIKNELAGVEWTGVEIMPAESRLVDTSNQYHLWCFDVPTLGFGFDERFVAYGSESGSVQQPWPDGERPDDAVNLADRRAVARHMARSRATK